MLRTADNILVLTHPLDSASKGAREQMYRLNATVIQELFEDNCTCYELSSNKPKGLVETFDFFFGYLDGLSRPAMSQIFELIEGKKINKVFVDGSNLGHFVKVAKQRFPKLVIYTFFHNVESRFFFGTLKHTKTLRSVAVLIANYFAERKAVRFSDILITLNRRDSNMLSRIYGRAADVISPMAIRDTYDDEDREPPGLCRKGYVLFVGGSFYANLSGIQWFIEHVSSRIAMQTIIIGWGFEKLKAKLEINNNVRVIGGVHNVSSWYKNAALVVAPIFDGSGMKTKVAEAMMHGKKIIGTPEAFVGYEEFVSIAGCECSSADEFVRAIELFMAQKREYFHPELRAIYSRNFSEDSLRSRFSKTLRSRVKQGQG